MFTLQATQVDNKDRYALATVTISRKGAVQALHFLQEVFLAGVLENAPVNSVVITAVTNRPRDRVSSLFASFQYNTQWNDYFLKRLIFVWIENTTLARQRRRNVWCY